jgi:hypothetical protein
MTMGFVTQNMDIVLATKDITEMVVKVIIYYTQGAFQFVPLHVVEIFQK